MNTEENIETNTPEVTIQENTEINSTEGTKEEKSVPLVENKVKEKNFFRDLLPYIFILVVVILIRTYIATPVRVSGPSMEPTLYNGQTLILSKQGKLERFKIVVIKTNGEFLIKRIIGMPGETIEVKNQKLLINNEEVSDPYGDGNTKDFGPIDLANDEYFIMGDNREDSTDSRIFGPVSRKYIIGTTNFRIFPLKSLGIIDTK